MILKQINIYCAPDTEPDNDYRFSWNMGDTVFSVECAIAKLQEWVDQNKLKTPVDVALANSTPIEISTPS